MNAPITPSLYTLAVEFEELNALLDSFDVAGLDSAAVAEALAARIAELDGHAAVKLENVGRFIRSQEMVSLAATNEAERLRSRAAVADRKVARLRAAVLQLLQSAGTRTIHTATFTFAETANGGATPVIVDDVDPCEAAAFEPELVITTTSINTAAVRKRLEAGQTLAWARLAPRGTHLRIR